MSARTVAAYQFKDWWMVVWLDGTAPVFPPQCACCLVPTASSSLFAGTGASGAVELAAPMCPYCVRHARLDTVTGLAMVLIGFAIPPALYLWYFGAALPPRGGVTILGGGWLITGAACFGALFLPLRRFLPPRRASCPEAGWPIAGADDPEAKVDEQSERTDSRRARILSLAAVRRIGADRLGINFKNSGYARLFMAANGGPPAEVHTVEEKY